MKRVKWLVGLLAFAALGLGLAAGSTMAQAKSLNYQALKYNTNQTSMASGYFVKPASVKVVHHKYVVTMHIRTAKKLTSYPVKVLSVNGGSPQNVRRVKDRAGNSNLYYSFSTTNLKKRINAKLAINVPKVYKATHLISFKFSTNGLPSLKGKAAVTAATAKVTGASTAKTSQPANDSKSTSGHDVNSLAHNKQEKQNGENKATSHKPTVDSSSVTSKASSESAAKASSTQPQTTSADKKDHSNPSSRMPFLIAGVVVIAVVVLGGSLIVMKKKE